MDHGLLHRLQDQNEVGLRGSFRRLPFQQENFKSDKHVRISLNLEESSTTDTPWLAYNDQGGANYVLERLSLANIFVAHLAASLPPIIPLNVQAN